MSLWDRIVRMLGMEARSRMERASDPAAGVDAAYRSQLEIVDEVRRHLVDLLTARKRLEMQVASLERSGARVADVEVFKAEIAELRAREDTLAASAGELRRRADALRAEREIMRARVSAAKAGIAAHEAIAGLGPEHAEIRTLLDDARNRSLALEARAAALAELVGSDMRRALRPADASGARSDRVQIAEGDEGIER